MGERRQRSGKAPRRTARKRAQCADSWRRPVGPVPWRVTLAEPGLVTVEYSSRREVAWRRLRATAAAEVVELSESTRQTCLGAIFGAAWAVFGPQHAVHDPERSSTSYVLRLDVTRPGRKRQRRLRLVLVLEDSWGELCATVRLSRGVCPPGDLARAERILTGPRVYEAVGWVIGFLKGYARTGPLPDFTRCIPYHDPAEWDLRWRHSWCYGVRDGRPFLERAPARDRR